MFLDAFWHRYPGLLYGLAALLGCYAALAPNLFLIMPIALLFISSFRSRLMLALILFVCMIFLIHFRFQFPSLPDEGLKGTAYFKVESLSSSRHHFGKKWTYKGTLASLTPDNGFCQARSLPCRIILPDKDGIQRPPATCDYLLHGSLQAMERGGYLFKIAKDEPWKPVAGSFSLAERRYWAKAWLTAYIKRHVADERSAVF